MNIFAEQQDQFVDRAITATLVSYRDLHVCMDDMEG